MFSFRFKKQVYYRGQDYEINFNVSQDNEISLLK